MSVHPWLTAVLIGAALAFGPSTSVAQSGDIDPDADSLAVLETARKAQADFERTRRLRMPRSFDGASGPCDEIVGRYCVRHDDDADDERWIAPAEHREVAGARDALLVRLRDGLAAFPGDEWMLGQRVHYLLEAGRMDDALDAARGCRADRWWCDALAGLVLHERGETVAAETAFARAEMRLPPDERRRWADPRAVLSGRDAKAFARLAAADRESVAARLWWLADPLWMRAGNDRLAEHRARLVRARIYERARSPEGERWGWDLEELLLRMGAPTHWEQRSSGAVARRVTYVTHRAPFGRDFAPALEHALRPYVAPAAAWNLTPHIPVSEYAPSYARFQGRVRHQVVVIPEGDSAVIAAVMSYRHDAVASEVPIEAALVASWRERLVMDSASALARRAVRSVRVARRDVVVSLEALVASDPTRAARSRFGLPLATRDSSAIVLSDPLVIAAGAPPASRAEAIRRLLLPDEAAGADSVGVYFESERLAPDVPVEVELMLQPERSGGLRRFGERLGLMSPRSAVRLAWTEPPPATGRLTRAVTLGFAGVPPGRYVLHLLVRQGAAWGAARTAVDR